MRFGDILALDPPDVFIEEFSPNDFLKPLDLFCIPSVLEDEKPPT